MLSNLLNVQISFNDFVGKVQSLAGLYKLYWLRMALNNLGRGEDDDLNFFSSILEVLVMGDNKIGRFLPESVRKFSAKLRMMVIGGNEEQGGIQEITSSAWRLSFEANQLTASIPGSIGRLQNLNILM